MNQEAELFRDGRALTDIFGVGQLRRFAKAYAQQRAGDARVGRKKPGQTAGLFRMVRPAHPARTPVRVCSMMLSMMSRVRLPVM